jgi:hypothetical protein
LFAAATTLSDRHLVVGGQPVVQLPLCVAVPGGYAALAAAVVVIVPPRRDLT